MQTEINETENPIVLEGKEFFVDLPNNVLVSVKMHIEGLIKKCPSVKCFAARTKGKEYKLILS
jgi:hypothetical protein